MQRAIEQAGSVFTGWISSCLFCLDSSSDDERARHQQARRHKGAEREMQICHSQPNLVSPMRLVVYDDLPSPGPPRASSFPSWVMEESRNLASRASSRASMSFKRKSTAPVRISAPTDFRRVTTLPPISTDQPKYRPLELSFQSPINSLPDLPRFSDYEFEEHQAEQAPAPIARSSRALSTMTDVASQPRSRPHRPCSSFNLPRKPVGSGSRRSSFATLEMLMNRQVPTTHPLIPHFSVRSSTASAATGLDATSLACFPIWPDSAMGNLPLSTSHPLRESHYPTSLSTPKDPHPKTAQTQSKSLPPIPIETALSDRQSYEPAPPATPVRTDNKSFNRPANSSPSRSSRVAQWLLQQTSTPRPSTSGTTTPSRPSSSRKPSFSFGLSDKIPMRIRSRTLSGSTLTPSINNIDTLAGGIKTTPGLPHTTQRTSTLDAKFEKGFELSCQSQTPHPIIPASRHTQSRTLSNHLQPTIQGTQQKQQPYGPLDAPDHDPYSYSNSFPYDQDYHHRHSAIGVAF